MSEYWLLRSTLIELKVVKEEDLPRLPFCGVHHVGKVLQPPPDWPVEAWHEAREAVEDLFCNIINWFELSKDFKENAAMTNNEKYRNRFSNEEIQNAVLLFNRFRKSYEFLKKEEAPSSTTISNRTSFFRCQPGEVQYNLLDILKRSPLRQFRKMPEEVVKKIEKKNFPGRDCMIWVQMKLES